MLSGREIARDEQDEPFHVLRLPAKAVVLEKLLPHPLYLSRGEVLVALALAYLNAVTLGPMSQ